MPLNNGGQKISYFAEVKQVWLGQLINNDLKRRSKFTSNQSVFDREIGPISLVFRPNDYLSDKLPKI